jgi:G:T/U-mismatch repair DNA glycosylase
MKFHTLIIGTSKSKDEDVYYLEAKDKFWKPIHLSGLTSKQLDPSEYRLLFDKGIGFGELAHLNRGFGSEIDSEVYSQDRQLAARLDVINKGIPELLKFIEAAEATTLVFNGKSAISAFMEFVEFGKVTAISSRFANEMNYKYGFCGTWNGCEIYLLPNLSKTASAEWKKHKGDELWLEFFKSINRSNANKATHKTVLGMTRNKTNLSPNQKIFVGLFLFVFCILAGMLYILLTKDIIQK